VKLLRVLQEREFERVGSARTVHADVRILAATHRDLGAAVAAGTFREDLFYRLHVVPIELPPLREHAEDIPLLAAHILRGLAARSDPPAPPKQISPQAIKALLDHSWPGNVRELENALEYAAITTADGWIRPQDLPPQIRSPLRPAQGRLAALVSGSERDALQSALHESASRDAAARRLGISRVTLWRKLKRHRLAASTK
jgi:DNA-binding NtrC family response regulator